MHFFWKIWQITQFFGCNFRQFSGFFFDIGQVNQSPPPLGPGQNLNIRTPVRPRKKLSHHDKTLEANHPFHVNVHIVLAYKLFLPMRTLVPAQLEYMIVSP